MNNSSLNMNNLNVSSNLIKEKKAKRDFQSGDYNPES
jgi:hypothetical protein